MFLLSTWQQAIHGWVKSADWTSFASQFHSASKIFELQALSSDIARAHLEGALQKRFSLVSGVAKSGDTIHLRFHKISNIYQFLSVVDIEILDSKGENR